MVPRRDLRPIPLVLLAAGLIGFGGSTMAGAPPSADALQERISESVQNVDDAKIQGLEVSVQPNDTITVDGLVASDELEQRILDTARRHSDGRVVHDRLTVVNKGQRVTGR